MNNWKDYKKSLIPKDISAIHKVKYKNPKTSKEFQKIFNELHVENKIYYSNIAEKRRTYKTHKDIKLIKYLGLFDSYESFKLTVSSLLFNINKDLNFDFAIKQSYVKDKNERIYMIQFEKKEFVDPFNENEIIKIPWKFKLIFIDLDVIYWEVISLRSKESVFSKISNNPTKYTKLKKFKIRYQKIIKTPFVMEPYNLQMNMAKRYMRKNLKITYLQIAKGILENQK